MKPTKNRHFCVACNHTKMLFETEQKAMNFIKFNAEEIFAETGKAPVRCYYCKFCGGWHVTSNPSAEIGEHIDKRDNKFFAKIEQAKMEKMRLKEERRIAHEEKERLAAERRAALKKENKEKAIAAMTHKEKEITDAKHKLDLLLTNKEVIIRSDNDVMVKEILVLGRGYIAMITNNDDVRKQYKQKLEDIVNERKYRIRCDEWIQKWYGTIA